ncbi:hypothetical protein H4R99_005047 [Coemansia sp. RSA 1722]|nr:hypothetical protein LPJ57_002046 [Coemansia sp. RSA 486]KAJ2225001.1 hypothetical protein IWW45_007968 [Coemansia sp. RSA 485]KAJ2596147.1 hypothetical protein H4R99_005047 [Coemansia sp. RSA 1722]
MSLDPQSVPFLRSCERCRQKKRKCSGDKPSCSWCSKHSIPCRYRRTMRFKKQLEGQEPESLSSLSVPVMFRNPVSATASLTAPVSQQPLAQPVSAAAPLSATNIGGTSADTFSADALARLLSVDMVPMSNPPPANLLQVANSFMTPLAGAVPLSGPEWSALSNTEASMLANLGGVAASAQTSAAGEWMPVGFNDPMMDSGTIGKMSNDFFSDELIPPIGSVSPKERPPSLQQPLPSSSQLRVSAALSNILQNSVSSPAIAPSLPTSSSSMPATMSQLLSGIQGSTSASSAANGYIHTNYGPPQPRASAISITGAALPSVVDSNRSASLASSISTQSSAKDVPDGSVQTSDSIGSTASQQHQHQQKQQQHQHIRPRLRPEVSNIRSSKSPRIAGPANDGQKRSSSAMPSSPSADSVPSILREYLAPIPGSPSPAVIYRIMRETFRAPRMGMVSMNLEMLWFMLHKGVLPRIVFYGHISSTIRCSVADLDIKSMVPLHIDESCYELALNEIPLVKDCAAVWGAVGMCMVTRYEFQSSRYKQMAQHADMALDIMHRIQYKGHAYPWHDVPAAEKESFGFQYLLAIYWKCFLWKLMSLMLIDDYVDFAHGLDALPDYSSKTYDLYTSTEPYDVDLMAMIPEDSWAGADPQNRPRIRFRGPSDAEFMHIRPEGSPCFDRASMSGSYMQQLLVIFAKFFVQAGQARRGNTGLGQLLKGLWVYKERMRMWRYSLPPELVLDNTMVDQYLDIINPASPATQREIDIRSSRLKDIIMLLMTYHTFVVRANRYVMKMMLGEPLNVPAPDVSTMGFGIRDLYDSKTSPQMVQEGLGHMNMYFHGCRIQAIKSANALCSIIQAAYACRFNFYTLGSPIIFTVFELLVVYISFLHNHDANIVWRSKARLSNIFNILRMLRHWAPALHMFVAGIKALSDPTLCLEEPRNFNTFKREVMDPAMLDMSDSPVDSAAVSDDESDNTLMPPKRRRVVRLPRALETIKDARTNILNSIAPRGIKLSTDVKRDETLSYRAADPIPEFPNPFPPKHIISLIIRDLGLSLADFLAPAYPILLLKLIPTSQMNLARMDLNGEGGSLFTSQQ